MHLYCLSVISIAQLSANNSIPRHSELLGFIGHCSEVQLHVMAIYSLYKMTGYDSRIHELDDHREENERKFQTRINLSFIVTC